MTGLLVHLVVESPITIIVIKGVGSEVPQGGEAAGGGMNATDSSIETEVPKEGHNLGETCKVARAVLNGGMGGTLDRTARLESSLSSKILTAPHCIRHPRMGLQQGRTNLGEISDLPLRTRTLRRQHRTLPAHLLHGQHQLLRTTTVLHSHKGHNTMRSRRRQQQTILLPQQSQLPLLFRRQPRQEAWNHSTSQTLIPPHLLRGNYLEKPGMSRTGTFLPKKSCSSMSCL